jgi:hypothetical protein
LNFEGAPLKAISEKRGRRNEWEKGGEDTQLMRKKNELQSNIFGLNMATKRPHSKRSKYQCGCWFTLDPQIHGNYKK